MLYLDKPSPLCAVGQGSRFLLWTFDGKTGPVSGLEATISDDRVLHGGCFNFLRGFGGEAVSPVIGDCLIDNCSAVDTFPGIKDQEEVREPFHHHQSFALRTIHNNFLPRYVSELAREGIAICDPARHLRNINNLALWELLIRTTLYTLLYLFSILYDTSGT